MNMHKTNGLLLTLTPIEDGERRKIVFYKRISLNTADIEQDVINGIIRKLSDCDLGNNINRIDGKVAGEYVVKQLQQAIEEQVSFDINTLWEIAEQYLSNETLSGFRDVIVGYIDKNYTIGYNTELDGEKDDAPVTTNNQNNNDEVMKKPDQECKATRLAKCAMSIDIETVVTLWNTFPYIRPYIKTMVRPLFDLNHPILLSNLTGVICNDQDGVKKHIKPPMTVMIRVVDSIPENHQVLGLDYFQATIYSNDDRPVPMEIWIPVINCTLNTKL